MMTAFLTTHTDNHLVIQSDMNENDSQLLKPYIVHQPPEIPQTYHNSLVKHNAFSSKLLTLQMPPQLD